MLKKETKKLFQSYLTNEELSSPLYFGGSQVVSFHWSNDKLSSDFVKTLHEGRGKHQRLQSLREELEQLKFIPIWLMSRRGQLKSDVHNLYQCYLDPRLKMSWFDLEEILVSMNHEAGPFTSLKAMKWFNKETYAKFIYQKMLESWVPQRSFRLSLNIPVEIRAGGAPFQSVDARIHQISAHGMVLNISSCSKLKEWEDIEEFVFLKKEANLIQERGIESCLKGKEWYSHLENFVMSGESLKNIMNKALEVQGDKDIFLYIPFDLIKMLSVRPHDQCVKNLSELLEETQNTIHKYVQAS